MTQLRARQGVRLVTSRITLCNPRKAGSECSSDYNGTRECLLDRGRMKTKLVRFVIFPKVP